jgi:GTP:adenosylcobinamide-phosphate guanylyltransferase
MPSENEESAGTVDVVVMAGSINRVSLYPGDRPGRKALVDLLGQPLIAYVLDALHKARTVHRIIVVGAPEVLKYANRWPKVEVVRDGHTLVRNAWRGLQWARTGRVLFCNPDQPLLRAEMIDDFVRRALEVDADLVTSWVRHEALGRYVEGEHKFACFGDGKYAHGNLFLVRREFPDKANTRRRLDAIYAARKNNFRFAWALGPKLFCRFLGTLATRCFPTLDETLAIGGREFGLKVVPVISPYPEIALDVDEPEDYASAERHLALAGCEDLEDEPEEDWIAAPALAA